METMKAYVIQKDDKYFVGGNMFEWTYDLQNAHRFLKKETAVDAIQKNGCLENANIIDCVIEYEDDYTFIKKDDGSTRPLTPEILTAAGWRLLCNDYVKEKLTIDFNTDDTISVFYGNLIKIKHIDIITVGEFNTLLDIIKLQKFEIK